MSVLDLSPAPGSAPALRRVLAQARVETLLTLRRGESLLLTLGIPVALLLFLGGVDVVDLPEPRLSFLVPGVLGLAVVSTAFTGLAISTAFDRRYGVLKLLGSTPLTRADLLLARTLGVLAVEVVQLVVLAGVGIALGWRPTTGGLVAALGLVLLGTAASAGLGLLLGGTLGAEVVLGAANAGYLGLLLLGGIVVPFDRLPDALAAVGRVLPTGALAEGLRGALSADVEIPLRAVLALAVWALAGITLAARSFRWE